MSSSSVQPSKTTPDAHETRAIEHRRLERAARLDFGCHEARVDHVVGVRVEMQFADEATDGVPSNPAGPVLRDEHAGHARESAAERLHELDSERGVVDRGQLVLSTDREPSAILPVLGDMVDLQDHGTRVRERLRQQEHEPRDVGVVAQVEAVQCHCLGDTVDERECHAPSEDPRTLATLHAYMRTGYATIATSWPTRSNTSCWSVLRNPRPGRGLVRLRGT